VEECVVLEQTDRLCMRLVLFMGLLWLLWLWHGSAKGTTPQDAQLPTVTSQRQPLLPARTSMLVPNCSSV
jgi:hypothetical protein